MFHSFIVLLSFGCTLVSTEPPPEAITTAITTSTTPACTEAGANEVYERWVEPLVTGGQPTSCNQCHLSGVDLSMFVQETPCGSMSCLDELELVDFVQPPESLILAWILKAEPDSDIYTEETIQKEHDGFLEWIGWSAVCHDSVCPSVDEPCGSGPVDVELPDDTLTPLGNCTEDEIVAYFDETVYHWRGRCLDCHNKDENYWTPETPAWLDLSDNGARNTFYNVVGGGYIDTKNPVDSLLLTKPLEEMAGGVWHGGGPKFANISDMTYVSFLLFIETYTETCVD